MNKNEIAKMPEKPLVIFKTEVDRKKNDIALMSNFFDGYINQLCLDENKSSNLQIAKNVTTSKIGLVKETINKGKTLIKSDMILVPDLDNIDAEIKEKLKKGIYSIGESKQVDGNLRAVIVDENNKIKHQITLKQQKDIPQDLSSKLEVQIQLREIFNKLIEIQEMQDYQIRLEKIRDFVNPFLRARDIIVLAEEEIDLEERKRQYLEADNYIDKALIAVYSDIEETSKQFIKSLSNPISGLNREKYMKFIVEELQISTKYVGVQVQLLEYLGNKKKAKWILDKYNDTINDFFTLPRIKNKMTLADLFQDYYPYAKKDKNMWYNLKKEYLENIKLLDTSKNENKNIYIISINEESGENNV